MSSTQGLLERPNGFYFQARIPKKYLPHFPKAIIRDKLPTENRKEAIALVRKRWALLQQEFDRIDEKGSRAKQVPTGAEADHLIALALHSRLSADDEIRREGVDDYVFDMLEAFNAEND